MYKLVTKIIVNRIEPFLHNIIGPTQASFLSNRRAADNSIIVQEYITHFQKMKGKNANTILKIDLKKVFDRLEWSFIRDSLLFFNFPPNMFKLIISGISSSSISILVNRNLGTKLSLSSLLEESDKETPSLPISSLYAWRGFPELLTRLF